MTTEAEFLAQMRDMIGSGLPDNFVGTITNARFGGSAFVDDGDTLVFICDIKTNDADLGTIEEQTFGIGKDWTTEDKGKSIVRTDGKKPKLNDSSKLGRIAKNLVAQDAFLKAVGERFRNKITYGPTEAGFYEGITGTFTRHTESFLPKGETEKKEFSYYLIEFDSYAGAGSSSTSTSAAAPAPAKKATKRAAKKAEAPVEADAPAGDSAAVLAVKALADEILSDDGSGEYDDFMVRAYEEVPGIAEDDAAIALVDDNATDGFFYTLAAEKGWDLSD